MGIEPQIPPNDTETEIDLLGMILVHERRIAEVAELLKPHDFYDAFLGRVFQTMLVLHAEGRPINPLTLTAMMRGDPAFAELGESPHKVFSGMAMASSQGSPRDYAATLSGLAARRSAIEACENAAADLRSFEPVANSLVRVTALHSELIATRNRDKLGAEILGEVLTEQEKANANSTIPLVATGLSKLDDEIGGFAGGDMIVVPSRPGMGKSSLLANIAWRAAGSGFPVKFFSLEMRGDELMQRMATDVDFSERENGAPPIHYSKFRRHALSQQELERLNQSRVTLTGLPLEICDQSRMSISDIGAQAMAFQARHQGELGLIIIDYMQIISADVSAPKNATREQQVSAISRGCKVLARRLNWPVLVACQLNRQTEKRDESDRRPTLADIRESGGIENDADLILAPFRKYYYVFARRPENTGAIEAWQAELAACRHSLELLCLKNRHGSTFTLDLFCEMAASAIRDSEPYDYAGFRQ